ncbi:MAG: transposase [Planctomycetia bacterium]|nr:transposase [Planctomycetia bacterium]
MCGAVGPACDTLAGGPGIDAAEIRGLKSKLRKYLQEFRDCFGRKDTRGHLATYVEGQLSKLDRKSVEPIALSRGVAPRTLQQFLNFLEWDQEQLIDTLQWRVARDHTSDHSIGLIDETSCPKKGDKTPGVQRQWCGATGKQDNCVTTVHLGYAVNDFVGLAAEQLGHVLHASVQLLRFDRRITPGDPSPKATHTTTSCAAGRPPDTHSSRHLQSQLRFTPLQHTESTRLPNVAAASSASRCWFCRSSQFAWQKRQQTTLMWNWM